MRQSIDSRLSRRERQIMDFLHQHRSATFATFATVMEGRLGVADVERLSALVQRTRGFRRLPAASGEAV